MPTTTYPTTATDLGAWAVGNRTDEAGTVLGEDTSAEEARILGRLLGAGTIGTTAWQVRQRQAGANMSVDIGSGTAKADLAVVYGTVAGQGNYIVRLNPALLNVAVPAADVANARIDEAYIAILDDAYDASGRALPHVAYRRGDPGAGAPGPDAAWTAYLRLASIAVAAGETAIENAHITSQAGLVGFTDALTAGIGLTALEDRVDAWRASVGHTQPGGSGLLSDTPTTRASLSTAGYYGMLTGTMRVDQADVVTPLLAGAQIGIYNPSGTQVAVSPTMRLAAQAEERMLVVTFAGFLSAGTWTLRAWRTAGAPLWAYPVLSKLELMTTI
jgi:hypothetical protein